MEEDAQAEAIAYVASLLQRPDQLEKLPELRKRADRKKASVEAMLRTGVQSQLEGIRTAIAHLHTASEDITAIDTGISSIRHRLKPFPQLKEKMRELRDANARHGQYAAAMENLKHIFNINQTVKDTQIALDEGKLLVAHKHIMDLELARDELMQEVFKLQSGNEQEEMKMLVVFFDKVSKLVDDLSKNMWFILGRSLEMVKGNESGSGPQVVVSCLRIIEREERIDKYYVDRKKKDSDFMPPGRPRQWKKKTFEVLEKTVWSRIEGNQLEDRTLNKSWLARYLEVCRSVVVDDLQLARAAIPCFPPEYQIYDRFVHMYHSCVCKRLREIASDKLEKSELVQLMSWIQLYGGEDLLGNRRLQINAPALLQDMPVLSRDTLTTLCDSFIQMTRSDMKVWLENTLSAEKDDWYKHVRPDEDNFSFYYTGLPTILFGMLRDTVTLTKEVSIEYIPNVINLTIEEFNEFCTRYKDAFTAYKNVYFEDRSRFPQFTSTMIAIANNLHTCIESTDKYMQQVRLSMESDDSTIGAVRRGISRQQIIENIDKLNARWSGAVTIAVNYLIEEVFADLSNHLAELFSRKWLVGSSAMETVCITVNDYYEDHRHLRPHARAALLMNLQFKIVSEFLRAIDSRRLTFATYEERAQAGGRLKTDANRLEKMFSGIVDYSDMSEQFSPLTSILLCIADLLTSRDKSLFSLEATAFGRKFPNIPVELLANLLAIREDVGRTEARTLADEVIAHVQFHPKDDLYAQLFSLVNSQPGSTLKYGLDVVNLLSNYIKRDRADN